MIRRIPLDLAILATVAATLAATGARWPYWAAFTGLVAWRAWLHRPVRHA